ncbi:MAG: exodeoxyribonuclease VII large subunit [Methanomassiliicoccales archaeon]
MVPDALSVADFIAQVNASLLSYSGRIQGEVTSVSKNYSTAIYFTIKDTEQNALLNCIIWRSTYVQNGVELEVGDKIVVTGTPEIYAPQGKFSLKTQTIEYAGEGALKKAYEDLKKKLLEEGLFAPERKRRLPKYPRKIGVITSKAGVVIQDFTANLGRYGFKITMVDSRVEGKDAIHDILASIKTLAKQDIEVLVVMRGGGSWESLQAFNTESVVRALAGFKCPVLTGIGHDVDVTLSELVADVGASTPTGVAEALNESWDTLTNSIDSAQSKVIGAYRRLFVDVANTVTSDSEGILRIYYKSLSAADKALANKSSKIRSIFIDLERKISRASFAIQNVMGIMKSNIHARHKHLEGIPKRLPGFIYRQIKSATEVIHDDAVNISLIQGGHIKKIKDSIKVIEKSIRLSDPAHNLRLGYSLSYSGGKLVRSVKDIRVGGTAETRLSDGSFTSQVKDVI